MLKKKPRSGKPAPKQAEARTTKKVAAPAPTPKSRALAVRPPQGERQVSTVGVIDFAADSRMGQENMTQADFAIPRLAILQDLSPQVQKSNTEKYIEGAEAGDICDTVSGTLYDGDVGIDLVAVSYRRAYIEWVPRVKGGGFVQDRTPVGPEGAAALQDFLSKCDKGDKGQIITPTGNEIKVSGEYFVFVVDVANGDYQRFVLNMGGSQMKKARKWNTIMNQLKIEYKGERINPAMFYQVYKLATVPERNDQGSWWGWTMASLCPVIELPQGETIYRDAKEFRQSIAAGRVSVSAPVEEDIPVGASSSESEDLPL